MKKPQLFFIHFAGGNCYSFQFMYPFIKDFEICPVELPGRGKRMKEGLLDDFSLAALDVYRQITQKISSPYFLIYGHSMGASLALAVADMLEQSNLYPVSIFMSGNPGPGIRMNNNRSALGHEDFITELIKLGGMPPALIEDKALLKFFLPVIRADFKISENYPGDLVSNRLRTPIYAIMGNEEEHAEHIDNWNNYTSSDFKYKLFKGGHFFIYDYPKEIADLIKETYDDRKVLQN